MKKKKIRETSEVADLQNQLKRALADYDNLQKRVERQESTYGYIAKVRFLTEILPVVDMFESAQDHLKDQGLAIALSTFYESLKLQGFMRIDTKVGDDFDENVHEAIEVVENKDLKNGVVVGVKLVGWRSVDEVVRPTKVVVNKVIDDSEEITN